MLHFILWLTETNLLNLWKSETEDLGPLTFNSYSAFYRSGLENKSLQSMCCAYMVFVK